MPFHVLNIKYNVLNICCYVIPPQYLLPNTILWLSRKISLRVWAVIFERYRPFSNLLFFLVLGRILIPECASARSWRRPVPVATTTMLRLLTQATYFGQNSIQFRTYLDFWVFRAYLSNLVHWVGFVTGLTLQTHVWIVKFIVSFWHFEFFVTTFNKICHFTY